MLPDTLPDTLPDGPTHDYAPFPEAALEACVISRFRQICTLHAGRPAMDNGGDIRTYAQLGDEITSLATVLAALPGEAPIGIYLDHGALFPIAMLACLAIGRPYVPLDTAFPLARNRKIIAHAGLGALVSDTAQYPLAADLAPAGVPVINMERLDGLARINRAPPGPEAIAYIIYTSGSTGEPKGVYQNQRGLLHDVMQYTNAIRMVSEDRLTQLYSASVSGAIRDIFGALLNGACLCPMSLKQLGAAGLAAELAARQITVYHSVPVVFRRLAAAKPKGLDAIRLVYMAGDRMDAGDVEAVHRLMPQALLYTGIGSTENATLYRHWFVPRDRTFADRVPVGRAIRDRHVALRNDDGQPVASDAIGEIVVTSRYMALGYWPDAAFATSPDDPLARVFHTGDLGRLNDDGLLEHHGRKDDQVKIRGYRVEPAGIEALVSRRPAVAEALVHVRRDASGAPYALSLWWVAKPGCEEAGLDLRSELPPAMWPAETIRVPALPHLANYKPDRATLAAWDRLRRPALPPEDAPKGEIVTRLLTIWRKVLGRADITTEAQLSALGADSLQLVQISLAIEEQFGVRLPPEDMLIGTLTDQADRLAGQQRAA